MRVLVLFFGLLFTTFIYADDAPTTFTLTTDAFLDAGALPVLYTCDDQNISPHLSWTNPPAKTQSFALVIEDPIGKLDKKYQWIVYDIPAKTTELTQGVTTLPSGALMGKNSSDKTNYTGPCPPKGSVNTYSLTLFSLDKKLSLPPNSEADTIIKAMQSHILQKSTMTMVYSRWP